MLGVVPALCLLSVFCFFSLPAAAAVDESYRSLLPAIKIDGAVLRNSVNNSRWYAVGAGYDYGVDDSIESQWRPALDQLLSDVPGLNALRIYVVDPTKSYSKFIQYTQQNGIYTLIALTPSTGYCLLNRAGLPSLTASPSCYPSCLLTFGQQLVNIFSNSTNTLAFMIGNEVMDSYSHWAAAPCVKAFARDLKAYQRSCSGRRYIPLIYTDADNAIPELNLSPEQNHVLRAKYLTCGPEEERIDAYGINVFRWCADDNTFAETYQPIYDALAAAYGDSVPIGIPLILTEYGCGVFYSSKDLSQNPVRVQRSWKQVSTLYGSDMTNLFSGGFAYTYGPRGGSEFAFYNGSTEEKGKPGTDPVCGLTMNGTQGCNVQIYGQRVADIYATGFIQQIQTLTTTANQTCPTMFGTNISLAIPTTRQGANGYTMVQCPTGTATALDSSSTSIQASDSNSSTGADSNETSQTETDTQITTNSNPIDSSTSAQQAQLSSAASQLNFLQVALSMFCCIGMALMIM